MDHRDMRAASDVRLELSTLRSETSGTDTRYTVALRGPIDENWLEGCRAVQAESPGYRRFELDRARPGFRFSCRTVDGTTLVFEMLERLEALVDWVNELVAARRAAGPRARFSSSPLRAR